MATESGSPKERIIVAAERLFAEHGVNGVSLRQIGAAAGNGNNSAVNYHFGNKDQLIRGVFDYRLPRLRHRRALLVEERRPSDLRGWLECQIRAVLEQSELDDSHYMGFVESVFQHGDAASNLPPEFLADTTAFDDQLRLHLAHLDEPIRSHRLGQAMTFIVHTAADRERARAQARPVVPFAVEVTNLADGMVGFLEAPVSPSTLDALDRSVATSAPVGRLAR
jgi:AcrR family transcriptional regulator